MINLYIARILYPVKVLGPGNRIGIWFCGCRKKCPGCTNPELWNFRAEYKTSMPTIVHIISQIAKTNIVDGFTISGGEPFLQPMALTQLLKIISNISDDILVYTGYLKDELSIEQLKYIAVLVDGKYMQEYNNNSILRGSSNQKIYILNEKYTSIYNDYIINCKNEIQNFIVGKSCISVGIHKKGFSQ